MIFYISTVNQYKNKNMTLLTSRNFLTVTVPDVSEMCVLIHGLHEPDPEG